MELAYLGSWPPLCALHVEEIHIDLYSGGSQAFAMRIITRSKVVHLLMYHSYMWIKDIEGIAQHTDIGFTMFDDVV